MIGDQSQIGDDELRLRARRRHRMILAAGTIPVLLAAVGFAVFAVVHDDASFWTVLIILLPILPLVAVALLVLRLQQRGHRWFPQPVRLLGTDRATRRRIRRIVQRGQLPAEEPDRGLGLEMARAVDRTRWNRWTMFFLMVVFAFEAVTTDMRWFRIFVIAYLILFVPLLAWNWRMYARVHTLVRAQATPDENPRLPDGQSAPDRP